MDKSSLLRTVAGISSAVVRLACYIFLQWIPGHHGPMVIIPSIVVYLASVGILATPGSSTVSPDATAKKDGNSSNALSRSHRKPASSRRSWRRIRTLLLGVPDLQLQNLTLITVGINVLLAASVVDFVFRSPLLYPVQDLRFSRVGHVSFDSARILVREPDVAAQPLQINCIPDTMAMPQRAIIGPFSDRTDFTQAVTFTGLDPETKYHYEVSNNLSGSFTTRPKPGSPAAEKLLFLTSSCIKANWPYNPQRHPLSIPGFSYLSRYLSNLPSQAAFMLFLGDFIYVDLPMRLGTSVAHYRSEWRRVYASPSWSLSQSMESLPWLHTLDDHEIANNWSKGNATAPFPAASDPFFHYHVSVNPPIPAGTNPSNTTYFTFMDGPASFFMLDTRRYRSHPEPTPDATILGPKQLSDLLAFISEPVVDNPQIKFKIIASSIPFTKNWRFGTTDTWGGYLHERSIVLNAMHEAELRLGIRLIILSGDRHEFGAIRFPPPGSASIVGQNSSAYTNTSGPHEYSVGPLSQFYLPIRTFKQVDNEDVTLAYFPDGNFKWGAVSITPVAATSRSGAPNNADDGVESVLRYTLYVDGVAKWEHEIGSPGPEFVARKRRGEAGNTSEVE